MDSTCCLCRLGYARAGAERQTPGSQPRAQGCASQPRLGVPKELSRNGSPAKEASTSAHVPHKASVAKHKSQHVAPWLTPFSKCPHPRVRRHPLAGLLVLASACCFCVRMVYPRPLEPVFWPHWKRHWCVSSRFSPFLPVFAQAAPSAETPSSPHPRLCSAKPECQAQLSNTPA